MASKGLIVAGAVLALAAGIAIAPDQAVAQRSRGGMVGGGGRAFVGGGGRVIVGGCGRVVVGGSEKTNGAGHVSSTPFSHMRGSAACGAVPFAPSNSHSRHGHPSSTKRLSATWTHSG